MNNPRLKKLSGAYTSLTQHTAKTVWPLTVGELKQQLEIADSDTSHDEMIQNIVYVVTQAYEHDTQQKTTNETWNMTLDQLNGDYIELHHRPVSAITHIKYYDAGNTLQTLSVDVYALDGKTGTVPGGNSRILLKYNQDWPDLADRWDSVEIRYVCGYGATAADTPQVHKQAMLLMATLLFEHRGEPTSGGLKLGEAYEYLMNRFARPSYP